MATKRPTKKPRARRRNTLGSEPGNAFEEMLEELGDSPAIEPSTKSSKKKTAKKTKAVTKTKKKTKKGKRTKKEQMEAEWLGDNRGKAIDSLFRTVVDDCRKEEGMAGTMVAGEASTLIGIPWPSFCLEWLTDNNVIPLSRMINFIGPPHSCKSAAIFEMFRIFRAWEGGAAYVENETKFAEDLCRSIMRYPVEESIIYLPSESMDHWQSGFQIILSKLKKRFTGTKAAPGPGRIVPVALAIDSLMGKMTRELQDKVEKEGSVSRAFAVEASAIKNWLGTIPTKISDWPFTLFTTNHLKPKKNEMTGQEEAHQPGGHAVRFYEAFEITMGPGPKSKIDTVSKKGRRLMMSVTKNSHGQSDRKLVTRFLWWKEDFNGKRRQVSVWDWHWATIRLLIQGPPKAWAAEEREGIKKITGLVGVQTGEDGLAYSNKLGVRKDKPVSYSKLGELLHRNEEMKEELRNLFGLQIRKIFQPDVDYRLQQQKVHKEAGHL